MHKGWLTTAWRVIAVGALGLASLASPTPSVLPLCAESPEQEGRTIFQSASGDRVDALNVNLTFELITTRDERFTSVPEITTNLGTVQDAFTVGKTLNIVILLPDAGARNGVVRLAGDIGAEFQQEIDRCPFERTFTVRVSEGSVTVN